MKKTTAKTPDTTWDLDTSDTATAVAPTQTQSKTTTTSRAESEPLFDLDGLMTDFPTARELEQFVYDQTGYVLNLKGRSNKFKYQTAMDVLNGQTPDSVLVGNENPYLDKNDVIPQEPMRELPPQPIEVRGMPLVTQFMSKSFPHPDPDWKASGQKCDVVFKKYVNNVITYEILGPVAQRAVGIRINKFGKEVPEKYVWVDPRQGEQVIRDSRGMLTQMGSRLRQRMMAMKINKSNAWDLWIDREFVIGDESGRGIEDPWGSV